MVSFHYSVSALLFASRHNLTARRGVRVDVWYTLLPWHWAPGFRLERGRDKEEGETVQEREEKGRQRKTGTL